MPRSIKVRSQYPPNSLSYSHHSNDAMSRMTEKPPSLDNIVSTVEMTDSVDRVTSPSLQAATSLTSWKLAVVIGSLCLGILLFGLDVNILGTAIPQITTDFQSLRDVAWYGSAYLLTVTAFQPLFGNLYKFFNAKLVYLASLLVFEGQFPPHISWYYMT